MTSVSLVTLFSWVDDYLPMLKESVEKTFEYTTEPFELIIVDNEALSETRQWLGTLKDPRIKICRFDKRVGVSAAFNYGIKEAKNDIVYCFDSDIRPNRKDWTQKARALIPEEEHHRYHFNIPYGWYLKKSVHVKKICDFYRGLKDKVVPQLVKGKEFHEEIRHRLESTEDFHDSGMVYQSADSDMFLLFRLIGMEKNVYEMCEKDENKHFLYWYKGEDGTELGNARPHESEEINKQRKPLVYKSRAAMVEKWKLIYDYGDLSEEKKEMIYGHRFPDPQWTAVWPKRRGDKKWLRY